MVKQLVSYIAPAAPATRRPAKGDEPFLRLEAGFTPAWYRQHLDIGFGQAFHTDPTYRRDCLVKMRTELQRRFPGTAVGGAGRPETPLDLLTGTYGACTVAAIYGVPIIYFDDKWPNSVHRYLTDEQVDRLEPPDLDRNRHFQQLMEQVDWIGQREGRIEGFINWQGVLNNAYRLRGEALLIDLVEAPDRCRHLFDCICETMIDATCRLHQRQRDSGVDVRFVTVSNCLVNLVSPRVYRDLLLPYDRRLAEIYGSIGIHNCAWDASGYLESYTTIPGVRYIDMGLQSNLARARALFPHARRALMYTPLEAASKALRTLEGDFRVIAADYGPCDIVVADIEAGTPDARVRELIRLCQYLSV